MTHYQRKFNCRVGLSDHSVPFIQQLQQQHLEPRLLKYMEFLTTRCLGRLQVVTTMDQLSTVSEVFMLLQKQDV